MMNMANWKRLGGVLHGLSYLKIGFYLLGFYYQFKTFFGSKEDFSHNICSMLLMFGLAMLLEALRDNEHIAEQRYKKGSAWLGKLQWVVTIAVIAFTLVVLLGLFTLYYVRDKFQGEAILAFGIGGLALFRLEYDCLNHALLLREKHDAENSAKIAEAFETPIPATTEASPPATQETA